MLSVQNVSASYGPYRALFDVSFRVPDGGIVALVGSNGSGKSTVARTVTGLVTASAGQVMFSGQDVTAMPAYKIARLGLAHVVEGRGVFSSLTVEENLTLAFRQRAGRQMLASNLARAYSAFPILGDRRRQMAGTLSGGQQRLLSLAKVLVDVRAYVREFPLSARCRTECGSVETRCGADAAAVNEEATIEPAARETRSAKPEK